MSKLIRTDKFVEKTNPVTMKNLWVEKHQPKSTVELAVHSKKIQEVTNWIMRNTRGDLKSSILLMTGPPGSGKTATLSAIPNLNLRIWNDDSETNDVEDFYDFLLKSSRFGDVDEIDLEDKNNSKVILVENFPNKFYDEPTLLRDVLVSYKSAERCPLVIILSDSHSLKYSSHWLIPKPLKMSLNIDTISFNPIAFTQMKKTIQNIIKKEKGSMKDKEHQAIITHICNISNGDIRSAINNLQMLLSSNNVNENQLEMNKDNPLFIFRALGKILYCKRETDEVEISKFKEKMMKPGEGLPSTFRAPLMFNPEEVFYNSGLEYSTFVNYLHENYFDFIEDIEQLDKISEDLSFSDTHFNRWTLDYNDLCGQYLTSTVIRSMLFHNESRPKNTWRPLRKSCMGDIRNNVSKLHTEVLDKVTTESDILSLRDALCTDTVFVQILPYVAKFSPKSCPYINFKHANALKELDFSKKRVNTYNALEDQTPVDSFEKTRKKSWRKFAENNEWKICKDPNEDNVCIEIDY